MSESSVLFFEIWNQGNGSWTARLRETQHFEHPVGNVTETLLSDKLEHSAVGQFGSVFEAEHERVLVFGAHQMVQFVQGRGWKDDFVSLFDVLPESKRSWIDSQSAYSKFYSLKNEGRPPGLS